MRIIALKAWSNGSYSMEEKQIAELPDALATQLIASGIVARRRCRRSRTQTTGKFSLPIVAYG